MECAVPNLLPITQRARDAGSKQLLQPNALISARLDAAPAAWKKSPTDVQL